jgi:hypothetical protein
VLPIVAYDPEPGLGLSALFIAAQPFRLSWRGREASIPRLVALRARRGGFANVNSSGMLHAADIGITSVCVPRPAGRVIGKTGRALDLHSRKRHSEHQLVVLFGLAPPGSTQVLTQKPRHPAGRAARIYAAGAMRADTRHLLAVARPSSLSTCSSHVGSRRSGISIGVARVSVGLACPASGRFTRPPRI